jgi:hypothetical protein
LSYAPGRKVEVLGCESWCGRQDSNLHMTELRSLLGDSVGLETRFPSDHSHSHSVHPQPCALADYPRSLFGLPSYVLGLRLPFPLRPRETVVPTAGFEPAQLALPAPRAGVYTSSTTSANSSYMGPLSGPRLFGGQPGSRTPCVPKDGRFTAGCSRQCCSLPDVRLSHCLSGGSGSSDRNLSGISVKIC